jgi:hypothetical protein
MQRRVARREEIAMFLVIFVASSAFTVAVFILQVWVGDPRP